MICDFYLVLFDVIKCVKYIKKIKKNFIDILILTYDDKQT